MRYIDVKKSITNPDGHQVYILDNHKIPRKYRKDYIFYVSGSDNNFNIKLNSCADWESKNKYYLIYPIKKNNPFPLSKDYHTPQFSILSSLVVLRRQGG